MELKTNAGERSRQTPALETQPPHSTNASAAPVSTGAGSCGCGPGCCTPTRRDFLQVAGVTALVAASGRAIAGPFTRGEVADHPVPADKKFSPDWIKSLTDRGQPEVFTSDKKQLTYIGMPVGGVCCGQLYLGGDGKLWHWDILNLPPGPGWNESDGRLYANPPQQKSPFAHGFALSWNKGSPRSLDSRGGWSITFEGRWPIGTVTYRAADCPLDITLEAFSPMVPLEEKDSTIPIVLLHYTLKNTSNAAVNAELLGALENPVCLGMREPGKGVLINRAIKGDGYTGVCCGTEAIKPKALRNATRPDIVFEAFDKPTFEGWVAVGDAFGDGPLNLAKAPEHMGQLNGAGTGAVNTYAVTKGDQLVQGDGHTGTLTSRVFNIERDFINFRVGGGRLPKTVFIALLVEGKVVRSSTGRQANFMRDESWDVRELAGKSATIQIIDMERGSWGQIGVDQIVFSDTPTAPEEDLASRPDFGTIVLAHLVGGTGEVSTAGAAEAANASDITFKNPWNPSTDQSRVNFGERATAAVRAAAMIAPGESTTIVMAIAWHFATPWRDSLRNITGIDKLKRHYAPRYKDAEDVVAKTAKDRARLSELTRRWVRTWYDSTLPYWLLTRSILNNSIAATATCHLFDNGRFYGWEGTYCCAGTCTHVWQYAQGLARMLPSLERSAREMVDYGIAFHADTGAMDYRAEAHKIVAHDGQCGTILRFYREHTMTPDGRMLREHWPKVKKSIECLIGEDKDSDGLLEGAQYNTLDAAWFGPMGWISSLYLAAVRAGEAMAREMGDTAFENRCTKICEVGAKSLVDKLYNGEYFIHKADPAHPEANSTNDGCHIDQVFGQAWVMQVGLGRVIPRGETLSALKSLYKYSFTPDVGPYREALKDTVKGGRWYAMPGEGGLLMCTFPKGGADRCTGKGGDAWAAGYFNECMNGFEYQVAAHMVYEGLVTEGLAVARMLHDRYHPAKRNPWNEIECSNHYARSMASYGVFTASCGFEHHGPKGFLAFAPKWNADNFRAPFTSCQGWGTIEQKRGQGSQRCAVKLEYGQLTLKTLALEVDAAKKASAAAIVVGGKPVQAKLSQEGPRVSLAMDSIVREGQSLVVELTLA